MKKIIMMLVTMMLGLMPAVAEEIGYTTTYVNLGRQSAVLYQPTVKSKKTAIGIIVMHSHEDYFNFPANSELSKRGYTVIATNPSSTNIIENKVLNIKACVDYLRNRGDIRKVILLGHSGGATVITAYQYLAEQGRDGLKGMLYQDYSDRIVHLPKADGLLLLDANPGLSTIMINSLDPNVTDESTGMKLLSGEYTYDKEHKYMQGQQERYARLVAKAQKRLALIKAGKGLYTDDEPFIIPGSESIRMFNKLYSSDTKLLSHTIEKWPLIHVNASITNEIIHSVRAPFYPIDKTELLSSAQQLTVRSFLSMYSITTNNDYEVTPTGFRGIDFTSNLSSPIGNIRGITVPSLFMGMTGSYEYVSSEAIYNNSPAKDKSMAFVEGASHMFNADKQAEDYNHADYGDTMKNLFDYVDKWLSTDHRFM
jgi:Protein of unknown function (DUF1749).